MSTQRNKRILFLCRGAIVAALYVVLTFLAKLLGLDSGVIQVRFSEMLCILPIFMPASIPGLAVGCFLSNLLVGAHWLDILIGPMATLIGALGTYLLRKVKWLAPLPAVLSNALIIPFVLSYAYGVEDAIPFLMLTVGIGELISVYGLGGMLMISAKNFLNTLKD